MKITKTGIIISSILLLLAVVAITFLTQPKGSVEFALAPSEMTLTINSKPQTIQHKQILVLAPGTYEATFSSDGFKTKKKTIVVENKKKNRLVLALTPLTDAAKKKLSNDQQSTAVINEYNKIRYDELLDALPLSGTNYTISSCQSIKNPNSDTQALCITTDSETGKSAALAALRRLDYNTDELELLIGSATQKLILESSTYRIDYYTNVSQEDSTKPSLFITPLNVPFVAYGAPFNQQLESIKTEALNALTADGYDVSKYDIFYSNIYLSKYNANADQPDGHAVAPIN